MNNLEQLTLIIILAPLLGSLLSGFFGQRLGRVLSHRICLLGVGTSLALSLLTAKLILVDKAALFNGNIYTWASSGALNAYDFHIGLLIDPLTVMMMCTVTFVSFLVHVYSIGYMSDDDGYQRFFSYISFFTFNMLMLVTANNFLQLFFGWEGVGLVSYLLIGFWFKRESANQGALKAFLVNRVGDFGFLLGIGLIFAYTGSLDYQTVFSKSQFLVNHSISLFPGSSWSLVSVICILLFIGAMGKSAQMPLHVWLPESMEGPTPISALIHAATMVTAGVFMVARMSPLFEYSEAALSMVMVVGATGALLLGMVAVVQNDVKRVVAYSTLSQLGYMMVAQGASAYSAGIFHLVTHACFKAVLFLAAGSVIINMHHEHDMRKMGGLRKFMPITWLTYLVGILSMSAIPPLSGFYSKDMIIEAAHESLLPVAHYAYWCVAIGAFFTALYSFRAYFMTFHGKPRMDAHTLEQIKESPWTITFPLIALAIPSIFIGGILIEPILFHIPSLLGNAVFVLPKHNVLGDMGQHFESIWMMAEHSVKELPFWLTLAGIGTAYVGYMLKPEWPGVLATRFSFVYNTLVNKFGFDTFNQLIFVRGGRGIGELFFQVGDRKLIDGYGVDGTGQFVRWFSGRVHPAQSGYLFHYTLAMVLGLLVLLIWFLLG